MFGIGYQEMMVIALIALIIFGPGKLPEVMREAGKHYKKFKGMADEMTGELNKVTSEARKELDGALGDLGPMGEDLEKSLGIKGAGKGRTTSTGNRTNTGAKRSSSSTSKRNTSSSRSTSSSSKKSSTTKKAASSSRSTTAKASKKPVVATKEDPLADFALFEGEKKERTRRSRTAAPSAITDLTPRDIFVESEPEVAEKSPTTEPVDISALDDPIARARARRRTAGYARA